LDVLNDSDWRHVYSACTVKLGADVAALPADAAAVTATAAASPRASGSSGVATTTTAGNGTVEALEQGPLPTPCEQVEAGAELVDAEEEVGDVVPDVSNATPSSAHPPSVHTLCSHPLFIPLHPLFKPSVHTLCSHLSSQASSEVDALIAAIGKGGEGGSELQELGSTPLPPDGGIDLDAILAQFDAGQLPDVLSMLRGEPHPKRVRCCNGAALGRANWDSSWNELLEQERENGTPWTDVSKLLATKGWSHHGAASGNEQAVRTLRQRYHRLHAKEAGVAPGDRASAAAGTTSAGAAKRDRKRASVGGDKRPVKKAASSGASAAQKQNDLGLPPLRASCDADWNTARATPAFTSLKALLTYIGRPELEELFEEEGYPFDLLLETYREEGRGGLVHDLAKLKEPNDLERLGKGLKPYGVRKRIVNALFPW
jgi:hypothetical protein